MRLYDIGMLRTKPVSKAIAFIYSKTSAGKKELSEFTNLCARRFPIRTFDLNKQQIQSLFKDYAYLRYKFGFSMIDYFLYELYRGSELVESLYMSDRDRIKIHYKVNQSDYLHYFGDKKDFYNIFKDYMQKDCIFIENVNDKSSFEKFVADKEGNKVSRNIAPIKTGLLSSPEMDKEELAWKLFR